MVVGSRSGVLLLATLAVQTGSATIISSSCVFLADPNGGIDCQNSFDGLAVSSGSFGSASVGKQLTGTGRGTSDYADLKVQSSATLTISGTPSIAWSYGVAYFRDTITISSPALNGSSGRLFFDYSLDGTIALAGSGNAIAEVANRRLFRPLFAGDVLDGL
jgi:hypothetical protein